MRLKSKTSKKWVETVLANFDQFLLDHAACERKASALAMSLVAHYPDRKELVRAMIELSLEELEHFKQVYELIEERGLTLGGDEKDPYVNALRTLIRKKSENYLLDRLLVAGVIEARGFERFAMLAEAFESEDLKKFYMDIARCEARHHGLFVRVAKHYFDQQIIEERLEEILTKEAQIVEQLPFRPAVH